MRTSILFLSHNIATGKNHRCALQSAEQQSKLINLDYNYAKKYNYNDDFIVVHKNHLLLGARFMPQGATCGKHPSKIISESFINFNFQAFPNLKILVQNLLQYFFIALLPLTFSACSGKVQTNKLPQTAKYHLPNATAPLKQDIDEATRISFENALKDFFKIKENDNSVNIYKVGIERGHFQ